MTNISNGNAYWVYTDTSEVLQITPASNVSGMLMMPPSFPLYMGWNLIGVVNLGEYTMGASVDVDNYLIGLAWSQVTQYDPFSKTFTMIMPNTGADLIIGRGYYVYLEAAGTLVP